MKHTTALITALWITSLAALHGAEKPNILVVLADDLGYRELNCQGYTSQIPTPHIDSIAKNGIRFTSGYVSGPYCSPIRGGAAANKAGKRNPDRAALFVRMDKNHDGKLSFEEFMANRPDPEAAKKLFEQWDSGKKGFLTREEFITMGGKVK